MEYILLLILGVCTSIMGIVNFNGNINTIHWYNRTKITKENSKKYGKAMGIGTIIIGVSIIITSILQMFNNNENIWYITIVGIAIGLIFMTYAQIKYNKGLF